MSGGPRVDGEEVGGPRDDGDPGADGEGGGGARYGGVEAIGSMERRKVTKG